MSNICVRVAPCWDQNSERVKCVEYNLLLSSVREQNDEMLIQNVTLKSKRVYECNKFQGRPRN